MKEQNYWQQFVNTGRIEDYLSFRNTQEEKTASNPDCVSGSSTIIGENPYAGICEVNRNGHKDGAYRGIR